MHPTSRPIPDTPTGAGTDALRLGRLAAGLAGLVLAAFVAAQSARAQAPAPRSEDETTFHGVVLGPDGRPVAGASVLARPHWGSRGTAATSSDALGRFRLTFDVQESMRSTFLTDGRVDGRPLPDSQTWLEYWPELVAVAPGFGFGVGAAPMAEVAPDERTARVVRLVADEPVEGRVLDLQGRPIAGASARVRGVLAPKQGDLTPWLDAARSAAEQGESRRADYQFLSILARHRDGLSAVYPALLPAARTDADGRFRIVGLGRERVAWVAIEKPGIESRLVAVATRPGLASFAIPSVIPRDRKMISNAPEDLAVYGPRFDHVAGPGGRSRGTCSRRTPGRRSSGPGSCPTS